MPIRIMITLNKQYTNLFIYDHIDGNRLLFPTGAKGEPSAGKLPKGIDLGPYRVEPTGSSPRGGSPRRASDEGLSTMAHFCQLGIQEARDAHQGHSRAYQSVQSSSHL